MGVLQRCQRLFACVEAQVKIESILLVCDSTMGVSRRCQRAFACDEAQVDLASILGVYDGATSVFRWLQRASECVEGPGEPRVYRSYVLWCSERVPTASTCVLQVFRPRSTAALS